MGPCSSNYREKAPQSWNPIYNHRKKYSEDNLETNQYTSYLLEKYQNMTHEGLTFQSMNELFPNIKRYSEETRRKFYKLLDFDNNEKPNLKKATFFLILINQEENPILIADVYYYMYSDVVETNPLENSGSSARSNKKTQQERLMSMDDYQRFCEQNEALLNNQQLVQIRKSQDKIANADKSQRNITLEEFRRIFQHYDCQQFIAIFNTKKKEKQQQEMIKKLEENNFLEFKQNDQVYLVEYSWFKEWVAHVDLKYGIKVKYYKDFQQKNKNVSFIGISNIKQNSGQQNSRTSKIAENQKILPKKKPGKIQNMLLIGDQGIDLKENVMECVHYALVPGWLWRSFVFLYGGYPAILRKFPQIHTLKAIVAYVDKLGYFRPRQTFEQSVSRSKNIKSIFSSASIPLAKESRIFYKYPGQQNWKQTDLNKTFGSLISTGSVYICSVDKYAVTSFLNNYNVYEEKNKRTIQNRIKNYASVINMEFNGVVIKGTVTEIEENAVMIMFRNEGVLIKKRVHVDKLKPCNPSDLSQDKKFNYLAGMNNFQNNCYMNSVVQCLIRTPAFHKTLESIQQRVEDQQSIPTINSLLQVYNMSKTLDLIDMQKLKTSIQGQYDAFQGRQHQDAQQFLLTIFEILCEQQKTLPNSHKIFDLFSGINQVSITCSKCQLQNKVESSFLNFSVNLPEDNEVIIEYIFIPKEKKVGWEAERGKFIVNENDRFAVLIDKIVEFYQIPENNLFFYSMADGKLFQRLMRDTEHQISYFQTFGFSIIVYEVDLSESPYFVQINHHYESEDKKQIKICQYPLLIPASPTKTWKNLQEQIDYIFTSKYLQSFEKSEIDGENLSGTSKKSTFTLSRSSSSKKLGKPFKIRMIKKSNQHCFLCNKKIPLDSQLIKLGFDNCSCNKVKDEAFPFKVKFVLTKIDNLVIMLKWDSPRRFTGIKVRNRSIVHQAQKKMNEKILNLSSLIDESLKKQEIIEYKCESEGCLNNEAIRREGIKLYPQIFIVHLNRFKFQQSGGLTKIQTKIKYDERISINGEKYVLFGAIIHEGNCSKGHYYSYVQYEKLWFECNDQKVKRIQKDEQINLNAYILFYRKQV